MHSQPKYRVFKANGISWKPYLLIRIRNQENKSNESQPSHLIYFDIRFRMSANIHTHDGVSCAEGESDAGGRQDLARQLHGLRSGVLRYGQLSPGT